MPVDLQALERQQRALESRLEAVERDAEAALAKFPRNTLSDVNERHLHRKFRDLELRSLNFTDETTLTIASGQITAAQSIHLVDTESAASADILRGMASGAEGDFVGLRAAAAARDVDILHESTGESTPAGDRFHLIGDAELILDPDLTTWFLYVGSRWRQIAPDRKHNYAATTTPGSSDDATAGYSAGSAWVDVTADKAYICLDAATAAAVWTETTGGGGHGTSVHTEFNNWKVLYTDGSGDQQELTLPAANQRLTSQGTAAVPTFETDVLEIGALNLTDPTELTISSGLITPTQTFHRVDTESNAATDNLAGMAGGAQGDVVYLMLETTARVVTVTDQDAEATTATDRFDLPESQSIVMRETGAVYPFVYTSALRWSPQTSINVASLTLAGKIEVATIAETTTGTDATRAVSPDGLAGSEYGERALQLVVFDFATDVATGDGKYHFHIDSRIAGMDLVDVHAEVITAGTTNTTDIQIRNATQSADILSTKLTIDSGETGSDTAAAAAVIDTDEDDMQENDVIRIDIDAVSTTAPKGLLVTLGFRLP